MGEFSPPLFLSPSSIMLMHRPQTPQPGFGSITLGPFIRGKIRRELYHLYEHVLSKTRTARINGSRLISVLDSFSCHCCL